MAGVFRNLGRMAGPHVRKAKWLLRSLTGPQAEAIQAELEVGRDMAGAIARSGQLDTDPCWQRILAQTGGRLVNRLANRLRRFSFNALANSQLNAFALPGGFVYVTRPLLEMCAARNNELAFVLAHEMAHVVRGHVMDRMLSSTLLDVASRASLAARMMNKAALEATLKLLQNAYSQEQEMEADRFAVRLMLSAEMDPLAGAAILGKLSSAGDSSDGLLSCFSTHPPSSVRMERIRQWLER
ncbi:MAG: M48 family metalloprotease [Phycisphaerae bacterium]